MSASYPADLITAVNEAIRSAAYKEDESDFVSFYGDEFVRSLAASGFTANTTDEELDVPEACSETWGECAETWDEEVTADSAEFIQTLATKGITIERITP